MLKSFIGIYLDFICNFYCIKNIACFQNIYFDLKNVHPILDFLTRRGKFILYFSDFYLFFYAIFFAELIKKNALARLGRGPAEARPTRPVAFLLPHADAPPESAARTPPEPDPFPKPPSTPPCYM